MPFFVRPTVFPLDAWRAVQVCQRAESLYAEVHPFQLALRWQKEIAKDKTVTKAILLDVKAFPVPGLRKS